jgi:hypothetical protein
MRNYTIVGGLACKEHTANAMALAAQAHNLRILGKASCRTCDRRSGEEWEMGSCQLGGLSCNSMRRENQKFECDADFSGWVPRRGALRRLRDWVLGIK